MRFNIQNPAFLQAGGNVGGTLETRFVLVEGQNQVQLSSDGEVIIESVQGGELVREEYSALDDTYVTINADEGTEVVIYGSVTKINQDGNESMFASIDVSKNAALTILKCNECTSLTSLDLSNNTALNDLICYDCTSLTSLDLPKNAALTNLNCNGCTSLTSLDLPKNTTVTYLLCSNCTSLTSLDLSKNTALKQLECYDCTSLTSLDLPKNAALTNLNCNGCTGLLSINGIGVNSEVSTSIASAITDAASVDGTVTLRQGDEFNQTIIDAAMEKGWDVQYYAS